VLKTVDGNNKKNTAQKRERKLESEALAKELIIIKRQQKWLQTQYRPLCKRLDERREERDKLVKLLADFTQQTANLSGVSAKQQRKSTLQQRNSERSACSAELRAERGYSTGAPRIPTTERARPRPGTAGQRPGRAARKIRPSTAGSRTGGTSKTTAGRATIAPPKPRREVW
jgi:hypothetical protein